MKAQLQFHRKKFRVGKLPTLTLISTFTHACNYIYAEYKRFFHTKTVVKKFRVFHMMKQICK